jgi:hypothetical protein
MTKSHSDSASIRSGKSTSSATSSSSSLEAKEQRTLKDRARTLLDEVNKKADGHLFKQSIQHELDLRQIEGQRLYCHQHVHGVDK